MYLTFSKSHPLVRVALITLVGQRSIGHYAESLARSLAPWLELHLFAPHGYPGYTTGVRFHPLPLEDSPYQVALQQFNLELARRVWTSVRSTRPDVVHLLSDEGCPWAVLWLHWAWRDGIPVLLTVQTPEPYQGSWLDALEGRLRCLAWPHVSAFHLHRTSDLTWLERGGVSAPYAVIPHGSFAPLFLPHRQSGLSRERRVLFFGRVAPYKGLDTLVKAALQLEPDVKVVIAGPGLLSRTAQRTLKRYPERFERISGSLSAQEAAPLFQRAGVLALPYCQANTSSLPLLAAAFGVPTVASSVGGLTEDVLAVGGVLVPPNNPDALASSLNAALGTAPRLASGREFEDLAPRFYHLYRALAESPGPGKFAVSRSGGTNPEASKRAGGSALEPWGLL